MTVATGQVVNIAVVTEATACPEGLRLVFEGGLKATLRTDHSDYELIRHQVENSLARRSWVGVLVEATGDVVDLRYAAQSTVRHTKDCEEDSSRLEVALWAYGSACYLTRDHPDFKRIRTTLEDAIASDSLVWYAVRSWPEESETEIWNKILDIRPVRPGEEWGRLPEASTSANGAPRARLGAPGPLPNLPVSRRVPAP